MIRPTAKAIAAMLAVALAGSAASASLRAVDMAPALAIAQAGAVISATDEDALPPPPVWNCTLLVREYRQWLEEGNDPRDWKYAGKTYIDSAGETYTWLDWIDFMNERECVPGGLVRPEIAPLTAALLPGISAYGATGATAYALAQDSPG